MTPKHLQPLHRLGVDLVMLSLGSDYQRVVQAVFEIAQVRLLRTYGFVDPDPVTGLPAPDSAT